MRFEISTSLNGNKVIYIARDTGGIVRLRKESLDEIHEAIREYNDMRIKEAEAKIKGKGTRSANSGQAGERGKEEGGVEEETIEEEAVEGEEKKKESETEIPKKEEKIAQTQDTILEATVPDNEQSQKKFLHSDIKEQIEEKKRKSGKKSFWDKLK